MAKSTTDVLELLGGEQVLKRQVSGAKDLREVLREGLPFRALESLAKAMEVQTAALTKIIRVAPRTLARRKGSESNFNSIESDRIYRVARIMSLSIEVLGSKEKAKTWLSKPNRALGGESPLSLLDTDAGAKQVEEVLGRITHGIFS
jgi:putative toxin-antitoxin system antitoxin component (TIGR02293 family)